MSNHLSKTTKVMTPSGRVGIIADSFEDVRGEVWYIVAKDERDMVGEMLQASEVLEVVPAVSDLD